MSFVSVIAAIKTILLTVPEIKEVHDHDKGKFAGYPAAVIFPTENKSDFETTTQNLREYAFTIRLHEPMEVVSGVTDHEKADRILRETVDNVITEFDNKFTLNGAVNFCRATPSVWGYQTRESGVVRVAEVRLSCFKLVTVI